MEQRGKCFNKLTVVLFIGFTVWVLLQFIAPMVLPENTVTDLSGLVVFSDNEETLSQLEFPWGGIYTAGDRLCHQKDERSFFINGNQLPFCSRCTAIWLGFALGLGIMVLIRILLDEKFVVLLLLALVPIGVDGFGQLSGFWESTNVVRVITGLLIGVLCGIALGMIIDELHDPLMKKYPNEQCSTGR